MVWKVRNVVTYDICMLSVTALESLLYKTLSHHFSAFELHTYLYILHTRSKVIYTSAEEGLLWHLVIGIPTVQSKLETVRSHVHGKYMYTEQNPAWTSKLRGEMLGGGGWLHDQLTVYYQVLKLDTTRLNTLASCSRTSAYTWFIIIITIIIIIVNKNDNGSLPPSRTDWILTQHW